MLLLNKYLKTSKLLIVVCLFLFKNILSSQNLVSNPSFENVDAPVDWNTGTFINATFSPPSPRNVTNWDWFNSPDYFSTNVPYIGVFRGIPINDFGAAYAKHGNAYGGISVYQGNVSDYKEYVYQQLASPLKQDSVYCLSFYTTLADRVQIAIKNMGAYFSTNIPVLNNLCLTNTPQVLNTSSFLTDTVNWVEIRGCFTALGGEKYITVGSFGNRASTDTVNTISLNPLTGPGSSFSYYYIDSVTLWQNNFPTAINEFHKENEFSIYPNPTEGRLKLTSQHLKEKESCMIKITDMLGREVKQLNFEEEIDITDLENGIYFVAILQNGKTLGVKKIIKQ